MSPSLRPPHTSTPSAFRAHPQALALAASLALGSTCLCPQAEAASLGQIKVLSHQNEPLTAVLEVNDLPADELATLNVVATGSVQRAPAGSPSPLKVILHTRWVQGPAGEKLLQIEGDKPIHEDVALLQVSLNWDSGRVKKDYVLLLTPPPNLKTKVSKSAKPTPQDLHQPWVVQAGQTASAISIQIRPPNTNLNQVLVALKDKNPNAFIKGNVNRLRAGVSLSLPNEEEVREITAQQAMLIITKDNQSFEQIREADRKNTLTEASGTKPADNTSKRDKLTLSRANRAQPSSTHTPSPTAADEAQADLIAQSKQDQEQRNRLAELQKTAQDLQSIKRDASPSESASPNAPPAATQITAAPAPEQATSTNSNRSIWIWAGIVTLVVGLGYTASRWLTGNKFREHAKPNDNPLERVQQLIQEGRDREAGEYLKAQLSSNPALMVTLSTLLDLYTPKRSS